MIKKPMDVPEHFEIRKSKKQKTAFLNAVCHYIKEQNYTVRVEQGSFGCRNIVIGDPSKATHLITAHYDTPASIGLPNFITPCNPVFFILWQILILIPFFAVAFLAGWLVSLLTNQETLIFLAAYIAYFGMLLLMMFGPANRHNANDNTSGVVTVLEIATHLPEELRENVAFVLFDLEEAGLIGSAAYRKAHKAETDRQMVINLDCVGDGEVLIMFPTKKLKNDACRLVPLENICGQTEDRSIRLHKKGFAHCPSDQKNFPYAVGVMAFHEHRAMGLYCGRIHTWRDKILEAKNVNILRTEIIKMISAAEK